MKAPPRLTQSLFVFITGMNEDTATTPLYSNMRMAGGIITELSSLAVLAYVLFRQGRGPRAIGFFFAWGDIWRSIALAFVGLLGFCIWRWSLE